MHRCVFICAVIADYNWERGLFMNIEEKYFQAVEDMEIICQNCRIWSQPFIWD